MIHPFRMRIAWLTLLFLAWCLSPRSTPTQLGGLDAQAGQNVQLTGRMSQQIMQHPVSGPGHIHYMDYDGTQIVLYSEKPIRCTEGIIATGRLERVQLGGPAGRKSSYSGYRMEVMDFICK